MEFDIGTLVYIIITIIAIVAGVLGKKKKPSETGSESEEGSSSGSGFFGKLGEELEGFMEEAKESVKTVRDEVLYESSGSQQESTTRYDYETFEAIEEDEPSIQSDLNSDFAQFEGVYNPNSQENSDLDENESIHASDSEILELIDIDEKYDPDYFEIVKDFDLGTAVIYSTIINRPDY